MSKDAYQSKFSTVMREFKAGKLHHGGSGEIVRRDDVAKAIAASEAEKAVKKRKKKRRGRLSRVLKKHYGGGRNG